jgi:hypothetical protein
MKVNMDDTERSVYPKTHRFNENIEKVWNLVCVDKAKNQPGLLCRKIEEVSQSYAKKKPKLWPNKWFLHYDNTPAQQTLPLKTFIDWNIPFFLPDLAPSNLWLFPKLRHKGVKMSGHQRRPPKHNIIPTRSCIHVPNIGSIKRLSV